MLKNTEFCGERLFRGSGVKKYHYSTAPFAYNSPYPIIVKLMMLKLFKVVLLGLDS